MTIRYEFSGDEAAIAGLHRSAFPSDAEAKLVDLLRDAGQLSLSMVAVADDQIDGDQIVGHVAFSPVTIAGRPLGFGLAPIAVRPDFQRRGIGSQLIQQSLDACRMAGAPLVVVLGDPAFYSRFGFVPARTLGLSDAYGGGDAFQVLLVSAKSPAAAGLVDYARAFDMFD